MFHIVIYVISSSEQILGAQKCDESPQVKKSFYCVSRLNLNSKKLDLPNILGHRIIENGGTDCNHENLQAFLDGIATLVTSPWPLEKLQLKKLPPFRHYYSLC